MIHVVPLIELLNLPALLDIIARCPFFQWTDVNY